MLRDFLSGGKLALPIVLAYLVLGMAAGALGASRGLSPAEIVLLSLILFAGSAQFVFPELYSGPAHGVVSAVFFINLRHLLYSTVLAQQARHLSAKARAAIGAQLTDETFLTATANLRGQLLPSASWMIGLNLTSYCAWCIGNLSGALLGSAVDLSIVGADFAGPAMFIALLFPQVTGHARPRLAAIVAAAAGSGSLLALYFFPGPAAIVAVAVLAATLGAFLFGADPSDREFAEQLRAGERIHSEHEDHSKQKVNSQQDVNS